MQTQTNTQRVGPIYAVLFGFMIWSLANIARAGELHDAAISGDTATVRALLESGADVNESDPNGTPLAWAMFGRQAEVAMLLLEHGANPNTDVAGQTPLVMAIMQNNPVLVEAILAAGAAPGAGDVRVPLAAAAETDALEIVRLLLEAAADPNGRDDQGYTPLHAAAAAGSVAVAELLIQNGADVNALTTSGRPPLHYAEVGGHGATAKRLRASGAQPGPIDAVTPFLAEADPIAGEAEAAICLRCHRIDGSNAGYVGPHLWNVVGRPVAVLPDFQYSKALARLGGDWDYETLNKFIARTTEVAPGTKMDFAGLSEPARRANLIAYLRTLSETPVPLP